MGYVAGTVYATTTDFANVGLPQKATTGVPAAALTQALQDASDLLSGYFQSQFTLPLQTWGGDVVLRTCKIAAYLALSTRGFDPEGNNLDRQVANDYQDALRWAESVSKGLVKPLVTDSSPIGRPYAPNLISAPAQGWTRGSGGGTCT